LPGRKSSIKWITHDNLLIEIGETDRRSSPLPFAGADSRRESQQASDNARVLKWLPTIYLSLS
jgi:hypothetical protein